MKEADIQRAILDYLQLQHVFCWRNNTGSFSIKNRDGTFRYFRAGIKGSADIIGIMPNGRFLAVEVKMPGKKPTPEQLEFLDQVHQKNGIGIVASSIDDVAKLF